MGTRGKEAELAIAAVLWKVPAILNTRMCDSHNEHTSDNGTAADVYIDAAGQWPALLRMSPGGAKTLPRHRWLHASSEIITGVLEARA